VSQKIKLAPLQSGRVIAAHGRRVRVAAASGEMIRCVLRAKLELVTGDDVQWRLLRHGEGVVETCAPRRSVLSRPDDRGRARIIAANVDRVLVVSSPRPALPDTALDAYLVAAEHLDLAASVVFNKADLADAQEGTQEDVGARVARYRSAGYDTFPVSAETEAGISALANHIEGEISVFIGPSGVGKSSLTSVLAPQSEAQVGALVQGGLQGAHTTTASRWYALPNGGAIIDSPGIREFGLWLMPPQEIAHGYREMRALAPQCKFRDCLHLAEPQCAVRAALDKGEITAARYTSYQALLEQYSQPR
jgi:ribosome biogenesis GTPase